MENDNLVNTVDELRAEAFFAQALPYRALNGVFVHAIVFMQPARTDIAGHDDDGVFKVNRAPLPIGETAIVKDLQQDVEDFGSGFLDFVKQNDAVWAAAHRFGKLPTLFVANVSGRRSYEPRNRMFLHVLGHVDAHHRLLIVKEKLCQGAGQFGFTNASRSQEEEAGKGPVGILQSSSRASDGIRDDL